MLTHKDVLRELEEFAGSASAEAVMEHVARQLHEQFTRYNWVGFYVVDKNDPGILLVGSFVGSFTPNRRIPLDRGLCGAAATSGKTIVVNNVRSDPRYLAGSEMVKSEIVIPIFANKRLAAELDVESYFADTFNKVEQDFLESCAALVGRALEKQKK